MLIFYINSEDYNSSLYHQHKNRQRYNEKIPIGMFGVNVHDYELSTILLRVNCGTPKLSGYIMLCKRH